MDKIAPDQFNGFSRIEYLSVFVALLYAFVVAEYFLGWGKMFRKRSTIDFSMQHIVWTICFFSLVVLNYYSMWFRVAYLAMGFIHYLLVFFPILIFYFASIYLFPEFEEDSELNLKDYFLKSNKGIILLMVAYFAINFSISIALKETEVFSIVNIVRLCYIVLGIITVLYNNTGTRIALATYMSVAIVVSMLEMSGIHLFVH